MKVLQNLICAGLVFIAYCLLGYYRPWDFPRAVRDFFVEKKRLRADVLSVCRVGVPIGTLMCSKDRGWLPVDQAFPAEMQVLRTQYKGRLAYFGKFAVIPFLQGRSVGWSLLVEAVTTWSFDNGVSAVVMMVNPRHVARYRRLGAQEIARTDGTKGLEKAPAVLMVIDYYESKTASAIRAKHLVHKQERIEEFASSDATA